MNRTLVAKALLLRSLRNVADTAKQFKRNSGDHGVWSYRTPPPMPSKKSTYLATGMGGICWFWVLWHLATEPEHVYGEWPYIHPCTWTDEELGIPPDSAGPLKK